jgi:HAD superfamily hydrolase (TIGR01484 family)
MSCSIIQAVVDKFWQDIRMIATDMDGTLTRQGKFTSELLLAFEKLQAIDLAVLIVTGRSAGWVNAIANYLPIVGAIAENGGLFYQQSRDFPEMLVKIDDLGKHRQELARVFQLLQSKFPRLQESADNMFRLTDWTFDLGDLTLAELQQIEIICLSQGWGFTYSTVQCHIKAIEQDKATGLLQVIANYFPHLSPKQVVTVGDSPNDESLFNRNYFPLSVGVANILEYRDRLQHFPQYITKNQEGDGFCEFAELVIQVNEPLS